MENLNSKEMNEYGRVWLKLSHCTDAQWDDIYEWTEQEYMDRYGVNERVAVALMVNVRMIVFGRKEDSLILAKLK